VPTEDTGIENEGEVWEATAVEYPTFADVIADACRNSMYVPAPTLLDVNDIGTFTIAGGVVPTVNTGAALVVDALMTNGEFDGLDGSP
jgi:hypothetical protein